MKSINLFFVSCLLFLVTACVSPFQTSSVAPTAVAMPPATSTATSTTEVVTTRLPTPTLAASSVAPTAVAMPPATSTATSKGGGTPPPTPTLAASATPQRTPSPTASPTAPPKPGWKLIFDDELNAPKLDTSKWNTRYWFGRTIASNQEAEYYVDDAFEFQDGHLRIRAEKRSSNGFAYTSGVISSHDKFIFTYGYFEARAKIPKGMGLWPALWLLPARKVSLPEIDILEMVGQQPDTNTMTLHYRNDKGQEGQDGYEFSGPDFSQDFHLFALEWNKDNLIWFVDDVERFRLTHYVPQEPMYILANLAVGGPDSVGYPDKTTPFPSYFEIDYIRVYQKTTQ